MVPLFSVFEPISFWSKYGFKEFVVIDKIRIIKQGRN
jgi:hypothetical protein